MSQRKKILLRAKSFTMRPNSNILVTGVGNGGGGGGSSSSNSSNGSNGGIGVIKEHGGGFEQVVRSLMMRKRSNSFSVNVNGDGGVNGAGNSRLDLDVAEHMKQQRFKMKEETKILLKLHVIREKAVSIDDLLKELKQVTVECQDELVEDCGEGGGGGGKSNSELQDSFVSKVLEVDAEVKLARRIFFSLCKHRPLERYFSTLLGIKEQMRPTFDISIQFFGIDWQHLFLISNSFLQLINELIEQFSDSPEHSNTEVDVILPSNILRNLATIEANVCYHAEAVLRGRLSKRHQEEIAMAQKRCYLPKLISSSSSSSSSSSPSTLMLQLRRIGSRLNDDGRSEQQIKRQNGGGIWGSIRREILYSRIFRNSRFPQGNSNNSDELWRRWHTGLGSVTMMATASCTPFLIRRLAQQQQLALRDPTGQAAAASFSSSCSFPYFADDDDNRSTASMRSRSNSILQEDTMESLELMGCVEAPRQNLDENDL